MIIILKKIYLLMSVNNKDDKGLIQMSPKVNSIYYEQNCQYS